MNAMEPLKRVAGLYVIIDPAQTAGRDPFTVAEAALQGGARVLQLREKQRDKGEVLALAENLASLCAAYQALFIVNDHADLALACKADGVHVGPKDLPVTHVRRIVGPDLVVGASTNNVDEAILAEEMLASYVAIGRVFPTTSKADTRDADPERVRQVKASVSVPVVAIGGINETNAAQVLQAGADAIAVISAVTQAPDVRAAAERLARLFL
jgi:thiamine-phosphate pyrophosphorylase